MTDTATIPAPAAGRLTETLLPLTEGIAAVMLAADLFVVIGSVIARSWFHAPVEWADDVARGLMVGSTFFGAASALGRGENVGISFFIDRVPAAWRGRLDAIVGLLAAVIATCIAWYAIGMGFQAVGQITGSGLPLEWTFYPMGVGAAFMAVYAFEQFLCRDFHDVVFAAAVVGVLAGLWWLWSAVAPDTLPPPGYVVAAGFVISLASGMAIGFALAVCGFIFVWVEGRLPGVIIAQQMARGIDNFVLLAVPFFILVGYLMEATGMSNRLIELLVRLVGRLRGGLNVCIVLSMVIFSGISGSKMADIAAVGSVLVPAARRQKQDPAQAVALLAASAIMAEAIPPCIALIILGFVANISIGGLFMAGLIPATILAAALIGVSILFGKKTEGFDIGEEGVPTRQLWAGAAVSIGLIVMIFGGFKSGFATATEISAFAALYAVVIGGVAFRQLNLKSTAHSFMHAANRSGLILFIVAAAQALAFILTLEQVPHMLGDALIKLTHSSGSWLFLLLSMAILIVMGAVLEGAAALIIFGPLLMPVAVQLGMEPLHFGILIVLSMGVGFFAPPLGLGLYGCCLVGNVPIEKTVKPVMGYIGLLLVCMVLLAFVPELTMWLPRLMGYAAH